MCEYESPDWASVVVFCPKDNKPWSSEWARGYHVCYFSSDFMYTDIWITPYNFSEV
jgi:hypothetical protein